MSWFDWWVTWLIVGTIVSVAILVPIYIILVRGNRKREKELAATAAAGPKPNASVGPNNCQYCGAPMPQANLVCSNCGRARPQKMEY